MSDQFYDPRTFKKTAPAPGSVAAKKAAGQKISRPNAKARAMNEIDNNTECFEVKTVGFEFANKMKTLRTQKGWTQKDLALRASVKIDVVRDYENGTAIPDNRMIKRFEQVLGEKLR
ncbi:Multiprotein-bridging factor 1 [Histomonas meleagridis]|uniref:Multiprotein-bridging factor 1 n=1 Tax=Histomonas meleagridis TaxID=135588 RepID=UPI00355A9E04|nr:Multiprotein-bridging factor 1 [Histomonas meleagridis]KAH0804106.1 Multiprotein-bridging factor 1 [Histomonas meleagridis]